MRSLYARRGHSTEVAVSGRKMTADWEDLCIVLDHLRWMDSPVEVITTSSRMSCRVHGRKLH